MAPQHRILIVEDERMIAEYFRVIVENLGYEVCGIAATADEAVRLADQASPDLIFMDVRLIGERDGVDAATEIYRRKPTPVVYVTGSQEPETMRRIEADHPTDVLIKPVFEEQLKQILEAYCA